MTIDDLCIDDLDHLAGNLPDNCIRECSKSRDIVKECNKWLRRLGLKFSKEKCYQLLDGSIWKHAALDEMDIHHLNLCVLSVAAWKAIELHEEGIAEFKKVKENS